MRDKLIDFLSVVLVAMVLILSAATSSKSEVISHPVEEYNLALQQVLEEKVKRQAQAIVVYQEVIRVLIQMNEEKAVLLSGDKTADDLFLDAMEEEYGPKPVWEETENKCKE